MRECPLGTVHVHMKLKTTNSWEIKQRLHDCLSEDKHMMSGNGKKARSGMWGTCKEREGGAFHGSSVQQARAHAARPEPRDHP